LGPQRERLYELMAMEPADEQAIQQCQEGIERIQRELRTLVLREMLEIARTLEPEQRERWRNMMRAQEARRRRTRRPGESRREGRSLAGRRDQQAPAPAPADDP
jgi:hypothetical protein